MLMPRFLVCWLFGKHGSHEQSHSGEIHLPFLKFGHDSSSSSSEEHHENHPKPPVGDDLNPDFFCQGPCKDGWISYLGYCHIYVSQQLTWKDAEGRCQSVFSRAHLTSVLNERHNQFLLALAESQGLREDNFWTGANSEKGSKNWADGSPLNFLKFPGAALNKLFGGKLCLGLKRGGGNLWSQINCSQKLPFICMYKPSEP
ncbi:struthiocalcin-2-like [Gastrophryne carolinensis]